MATTYTKYLKLKVTDSTTADAVSNLQKIDQLGSAFTLTTAESLNINSVQDIYFRPNAQDVGGDGIGGNLYISTGDQLLDSVEINALYTQIGGDLHFKNGNYYIALRSPTLSQSFILTLPSSDGTSGQALVTDGHGHLSFQDVSGGASKQSGYFMWMPGDGTTKVIPHNYNNSNVVVTIYDTYQHNNIMVETISITTADSITLTSAVAPTGSGYKVFIQSV